jgi:hypothetical protein
LLAVLLPHTAWAFGHFESPVAGWLGFQWGILSAWAAAFAFEAAIAALTHRLAKRIETTPRYATGNVFWRRLSYQYFNSFAAGLFVALVVSALANFGHSVEFGQDFAIFTRYDVSPLLYSLAFGGILPLVSLLFARILADTTEIESVPNLELSQAKQTTKRLKEELQAAEEVASVAETRAIDAERRFSAAGDLVVRLFAQEKRQRILAAAERWPQLPASSIAVISEASPSYVSEVLKSINGQQVSGSV